MIFITPSTLTQAVKYHRDILHNIAASLLPKSSPDFEQRKAGFLAAADGYDSEKVNALVEEAIKSCCGNTDTGKGLEDWCAKFGILPDYPLMGAFDWARLIARKADKIDKILLKEGL